MRTLFDRWAVVGVGAAMLGLLAGSALAQNQAGQSQGNQGNQQQSRQNQNQTQQGQNSQRQAGQRANAGQQGTMGGVDDRTLAAWLMIESNGEVQEGQLAQREAQSQQVKQFAQMMVQDHTSFIQKLQRFAPELNLQSPPRESQQAGQQSQPRQNQVAQNQQGATSRTALRPTGGQGGIIELKQQLAQQKLQTVTQALRDQREDQFDRAYIRHQVGEHMLTLGTLRVFRQHASQELAPVIDDGIKTIEQHLQHAQQLLASLRQGGTQGQGQNQNQNQNQGQGNTNRPQQNQK